MGGCMGGRCWVGGLLCPKRRAPSGKAQTQRAARPPATSHQPPEPPSRRSARRGDGRVPIGGLDGAAGRCADASPRTAAPRPPQCADTAGGLGERADSRFPGRFPLRLEAGSPGNRKLQRPAAYQRTPVVVGNDAAAAPAARASRTSAMGTVGEAISHGVGRGLGRAIAEWLRRSVCELLEQNLTGNACQRTSSACRRAKSSYPPGSAHGSIGRLACAIAAASEPRYDWRLH